MKNNLRELTNVPEWELDSPMNLAGLTEVINTPEGKVDSPINKFAEEEAPFDASDRKETPITKVESSVEIQEPIEVPDTEVPEVESAEAPDTDVPEVESVEAPDTEVPDIQTVQAPDIPDLKSVEAPDVFSDQDSLNVEAPNMEIGYPPMQQQNDAESPSETSYKEYEQTNPSMKEYDTFSAATSEYNSSYEEPPRKARDFADTMAETVFGTQREMRDLPNTGGFGQEMAPMFNINVSLGGGEDEFVRQLTEQLTPKINEQQYIIQELTKQHFEMNNSLLFLMGDD